MRVETKSLMLYPTYETIYEKDKVKCIVCSKQLPKKGFKNWLRIIIPSTYGGGKYTEIACSDKCATFFTFQVMNDTPIWLY